MPVLAALFAGAVSLGAWTTWVTAQQEPYAPLAQYGIAGIMFIALLRLAQWNINRMAKDLDSERAYSRGLTERIESTIIPAALKMTEVAERLARYLEAPR